MVEDKSQEQRLFLAGPAVLCQVGKPKVFPLVMQGTTFPIPSPSGMSNVTDL
ncbi:unnamed protein product, partial [marine sediment metagenome]